MKQVEHYITEDGYVDWDEVFEAMSTAEEERNDYLRDEGVNNTKQRNRMDVKTTKKYNDERVFLTNVVHNSPVLLRVWHTKNKKYVRSRLDCYGQFSMPFKGRNKHPEVGLITVVKEITGTDQANKLLCW